MLPFGSVATIVDSVEAVDLTISGLDTVLTTPAVAPAPAAAEVTANPDSVAARIAARNSVFRYLINAFTFPFRYFSAIFVPLSNSMLTYL